MENSFDHLISRDHQARWDGETERLRRLKVESRVVLGGRLHREVGRFRAASGCGRRRWQFGQTCRSGQSRRTSDRRPLQRDGTEIAGRRYLAASARTKSRWVMVVTSGGNISPPFGARANNSIERSTSAALSTGVGTSSIARDCAGASLPARNSYRRGFSGHPAAQRARQSAQSP